MSDTTPERAAADKSAHDLGMSLALPFAIEIKRTQRTLDAPSQRPFWLGIVTAINAFACADLGVDEGVKLFEQVNDIAKRNQAWAESNERN